MPNTADARTGRALRGFPEDSSQAVVFRCEDPNMRCCCNGSRLFCTPVECVGAGSDSRGMALVIAMWLAHNTPTIGHAGGRRNDFSRVRGHSLRDQRGPT
jgi:hypothetical protein